MSICQVIDVMGDCTFPGEYESERFGRVCLANHQMEMREDSERAIAAMQMHRKPANSGLYGKYIIAKADNTPIDPQADYFVLRLDADDMAREAALTYADACAETNPQLAADLRARVKRYVSSMEEALDVTASQMAREMRDEVDARILDELTEKKP